MPKKSWKILVGDCRDKLRELQDQSVHMVWTSPPYFGLRDYGNDDQIGLEPTPDDFVEAMVTVMGHVRRVLRDDGTLWLNIGESYGGVRGNIHPSPDNKNSHEGADTPTKAKKGTLRKQLLGIPWQVVLALQTDGWYLRSNIIWAKGVSGQDDFKDDMWQAMYQAGVSETQALKAMELVDPHVGSCMPEAVKDRPTTSHEHLFLLAKNEKYFYDHYAIREDPSTEIDGRGSWEERKKAGHPTRYGDTESKSYSGEATMPSLSAIKGGRNRRTVWCVGTSSFSGAHFATAPEPLIEPCLKAGTSEYGCCVECGSPYERVMNSPGNPEGILGRRGEPNSRTHGGGHEGNVKTENEDGVRLKKGHNPTQSYKGSFEGWKPTCDCTTEEDPIPCTVLDPFAGAGTTMLVAEKLGRRSIGLELNPEYAQIAEDRLEEHTRNNYGPWDERYIPLDGEDEIPDEMGVSDLFGSGSKEGVE